MFCPPRHAILARGNEGRQHVSELCDDRGPQYRRDKLFSLINLGGLAASLPACLLIFLFVWSELNFDNWVTDGERIYRVEATYSPMGREPVPATTVGGPMRAAPRHWARF